MRFKDLSNLDAEGLKRVVGSVYPNQLRVALSAVVEGADVKEALERGLEFGRNAH